VTDQVEQPDPADNQAADACYPYQGLSLNAALLVLVHKRLLGRPFSLHAADDVSQDLTAQASSSLGFTASNISQF
jgi:hypothetical protein